MISVLQAAEDRLQCLVISGFNNGYCEKFHAFGQFESSDRVRLAIMIHS